MRANASGHDGGAGDKGIDAPGSSRASVLNIAFHGIGTPGPGVDAEAQGYFIGADLFLALLDEVRERPGVELSFDDGYASDVYIAMPELAARGLVARFFPLAGQLRRPGYVDADGVRELVAAGMTVGSHGMRHRSWRGLDATVRQEELVEARQLLSSAAGATIDTAACPFGAYDRGTLVALREEGYAHVFTSDRRSARAGAWLQPRYSVRQGDTLQSVRDDILAPRPFPERARGALAARVKAWR
jgi:peptidoglycan/xylan/chitin deacetylase (PgdA/CDA1 family)